MFATVLINAGFHQAALMQPIYHRPLASHGHYRSGDYYEPRWPIVGAAHGTKSAFTIVPGRHYKVEVAHVKAIYGLAVLPWPNGDSTILMPGESR